VNSEDTNKPINGNFAKNTILNLIGQLLPMVVAIVTIPIIIRHMGTDRFGILTIAWMLIGYFSLFDMGLGRALTQLIAEKLGKDEYDDIPGVFWTAMSLMLAFSIFGTIILAILASPLVHGVLKIPVELQPETLLSLYLLIFSMPVVILTAALIGFLAAYNRFDIINRIRIPTGIYSYAVPLLILPYSNNLFTIIIALVAGRVVTFLVHFYYCLQIVPALQVHIVIQKSIIKPLFRYGGWMTISNIIGPFMVYFDRFLIGSMLSVAAVAYYATPYEFVTKLLIIPAALLGVLFPAFASTHAQKPAATFELLRQSTKYLLLAVFPIVLLIVACAQEGLTLWLGASFAENSYQTLQFLTIGIFVNCLAQAPFTFIQGIGKPHITTTFHLFELVIYLPALWVFVKMYGIKGAAAAWALRAALDALLLFFAARRLCRPFPAITATTGNMLIAGIAALSAVMLINPVAPRYFVTAIVLLSFCYLGWKKLLNDDDRTFFCIKINPLTRP
jgi:O-antigen/teichoic acid export membrane protein